MKTKCPHCNTKFKVSDDYKGRKTKCPKCKQLFTISEFIDKPAPSTGETKSAKSKPEVCEICGGTIGKLEKTHVFNKMDVCAECYKDLQRNLVPSSGLSASGSTAFQSMPTKGDKIWRAYEQFKVFRGLCRFLNPLCVIVTVVLMAASSMGHERPGCWADLLQGMACIWLIVSGILYFILRSRSKGK